MSVALMLLSFAQAQVVYDPGTPGDTAPLLCNLSLLEPDLILDGPIWTDDDLVWVGPTPPLVEVEIVFWEHVGFPPVYIPVPTPIPAQMSVKLPEDMAADSRVMIRTRVQGGGWEDGMIRTPIVQPQTLEIPTVVGAVRVGDTFVHAADVLPGAMVEVRQGTQLLGVHRASADQVIVPLDVHVPDTSSLSVKQWLPSAVASGPLVLDPWPYVSIGREPRLLTPVADDDTLVWVSHVTPGATVKVVDRDTGDVLGSASAEEGLVRMRICPVDGDLRAEAYHGMVVGYGDWVDPVINPSYTGSEGVTTASTSYGGVAGELYRPSSVSSGDVLPMAVIVHGQPPDGTSSTSDSWLGYDSLARHLASWGFVVFSADAGTSTGITYRADLGEDALLAMVADDAAGGLWSGAPTDLLDEDRIAVIGQSFGGGAVIEIFNRLQGTACEPAAVVAITPQVWTDTPDPMEGSGLLTLTGSLDVTEATSLGYSTAAWRGKSHLWIPGASHNGFNSAWDAEDPMSGDLTVAEHAEVAETYTLAWLRARLQGVPVYEGYLQGPMKAGGLYHYETSVKYAGDDAPGSEPQVLQVDGFGSDDDELGITGDSDATINDLGGAVTVGVGLSSSESASGLALTWSFPVVGRRYTTAIPSADAPDLNTTDVLVFDIKRPESGVGSAGELGLYVELTDGTNTASVSVSVLVEPITAVDGETAWNTVRVPMDAFIAAASSLDIDSLDHVRIGVQEVDMGGIDVDNVSFEAER